MSRERNPATGAVLMLVGGWVFAQATMGNLVDRIQSYTPGGGDKDYPAGAKGSAAKPAAYRGKALSIGLGVKRGDRIVFDTIAPACERAGGGFLVTSWHRPGAVTTSGRPSCHRHGKKTGKGALDIVSKDGDFSRLDTLDAELRATKGVGEVIYRGAAGHDPRLEKDSPHLHAAVNCG